MERTGSAGNARERARGDEFELEAKLASAERRYAQARERSRQALEECLAMEATGSAPPEVLKRIRERRDIAEAKCATLRQLIAQLEDTLD